MFASLTGRSGHGPAPYGPGRPPIREDYEQLSRIFEGRARDPNYDDLPMEDFVPLLEEVFARQPQYTA
ncbi:MAG: hypothetical protein F4017_11715 [Acidimicrobiaceae bacterium]|nr:hypothetical protein [Acidimicrobiaceae bacterium]MYE76750.1 hypothetical protein [Acidimicrobiaceae bacterium]MYJ43556.1 hypothetical protein [Acidimicrobiaceae bacterium]MYK75233.1 hypothetical protein [Acidimicrobiaceae bacterium]